MENKTQSPLKAYMYRNPMVVVVASILLVIIGLAAFSFTVITGNDKIAYELILEHAQEFNDPSSVRIVSGTVGRDMNEGESYMFCVLSAANGYGARSSGPYYLCSDFIYEDPDADDLCEREDLDFNKINRKLKKALKNVY